jgi:biotin carboxyl carrier protein
MRWSPRAIRVGVVISLVLPAFVILMTSSLQAQFPKGGPKPPVFQPPQNVWTCGNPTCRKEIGRGAFPPATCPFCGAKILNGIGPAKPNPVNPQPQPQPKQFPTPPVNPNPGQQGLAGTSWSGSETLPGYGALTFQFQPGGQATMIDKDGNQPGTWNQGGNSISLTFANGGVIYNGTITGGQMSGTARNDKENWSWSVSNPGFNVAANPPVNPGPINPQPINPKPIINPTPQPFVPGPVNPQPVSTPAPPTAKAPAAEPQNAAVESPRPSRVGLIAVLVGVVFVGLGLAVLGGGIIFIVKAMK